MYNIRMGISNINNNDDLGFSQNYLIMEQFND